MALTKEDLQAIRTLIQEETAPINARLDTMQADISEIKEKIIDIDESIGAIAEWADDTAKITKVPFAGGRTSLN